MKLRALFALLLLTLALPAQLAADAPSTPDAAAPAVAAPAPAGGPETAPASTPLVAVQEPAPQGGFQGCPFEDVFFLGAPIGSCVDGEAVCTPLCSQNGGTLIAAVTSTGADCTCICCRI